MQNPHSCYVCEEKIKPEELQPGCAPDVFYHKICFSIAVASLEHDVEAALRSAPDKYTELANGKWIENQDLENLKVDRELFHHTIWGGNLQDPFYYVDLNVTLAS